MLVTRLEGLCGEVWLEISRCLQLPVSFFAFFCIIESRAGQPLKRFQRQLGKLPMCLCNMAQQNGFDDLFSFFVRTQESVRMVQNSKLR